ncbi:MAG: AsmA family protein [Acidobacteria bacterium]|nr:AsmA family protein [Acidobacteriota bacterium]
MRRKRVWVAGLLLLALVFCLPLLLNLSAFRPRVHQALERRLGRPVELASLTARLLPRPGLVGRAVRVYDAEEFGAEPFLYADEVTCDLALATLWSGRLEFARLHFQRPTVNLVRLPDRDWNLGRWLAGAPESAAPPLPVVSGAQGRINFKLGPDKQVYALSEVAWRLEPAADGWRVTLEAVPMRVDRRLTETGTVRVRGQLGRAADFSAVPFRLEATLEDGSLAQWWTFFGGETLPVHATARLAARFDGRPADWKSEGTLTLANLHRRDLVAPPRSPRWELEFAVRARREPDVVEFEKAVLRAGQSEVQLSGRLHEPFARRRWDVEVSAGRLALDELGAQLAALKADLSPQLRWEGAAQLAFQLPGRLAAAQGLLAAPAGVALRVPGLVQPVVLGELRLRWQRERLELLPLTLQFRPEHALALSGEMRLDSPRWPYRVRWQSRDVSLEPLWRTADALGWPLFPARWEGRGELDLEWRGELLGDAPAEWRGHLSVRDARFHPAEFNEPLAVRQARLAWSGTQLEVRPLVVEWRDSALNATLLRRRSEAPWQVTLSAPQLRLADLNALLNPAQRSLFARLVRPETRRAPLWDGLEAVGEVKVGELRAGPFRLRGVEAQGELRGKGVELRRLRFHAYGGGFDGRLEARFESSPPRYHLSGNLRHMPLAPFLADTTRLSDFFTGLVSAELSLETAGTRPRELLRGLQGRVVGSVNHGSMTHVNLLAAMSAAAGLGAGKTATGTVTPLESLAGDFRVADEQVELNRARLITDGAALGLTGRVSFAGRLDLGLTGEPIRVAGREPDATTRRVLGASYRLTGTLSSPEVRLAERLPPAAPSR